MSPSATKMLPKPSYLRLFEYQKRRMAYAIYSPDFPLLFFIFFSRIASGLSILSVFFPPSVLWIGVAFLCMVLATAASITHLSVPTRFLTMIINHRSPLVWEIRLAGALTISLGAQLLSRMGFLPGFEILLFWTSPLLSVLFLISTGWAYGFHTHPAWKTPLLPAYYLASASMIGMALYSITFQNPFFRLLTVALLCTEGFLILLYLNHLYEASWTSLENIVLGKERWISAGFLGSVILVPGLITFATLFVRNVELFAEVLALSNGVAVVFERILFFRVEKQTFFLSRTPNSEESFSFKPWILRRPRLFFKG
jgi:DMSO reductase anchor subunit